MLSWGFDMLTFPCVWLRDNLSPKFATLWYGSVTYFQKIVSPLETKTRSWSPGLTSCIYLSQLKIKVYIKNLQIFYLEATEVPLSRQQRQMVVTQITYLKERKRKEIQMNWHKAWPIDFTIMMINDCIEMATSSQALWIFIFMLPGGWCRNKTKRRTSSWIIIKLLRESLVFLK